MQTLITEEARNCCELRLPAGSRNDRAQLVTLHTSDLFYSDPSLRSGVTGRSVFNPRLEQPRYSNSSRIRTRETTTGPLPQQMARIGDGRAQYGNSPRYLCQLRDKARWANCA